jgi:hypothetical protein
VNPQPKCITIKPASNIPIEVTPVSNGLEVSGNYGPQMMFNLAGNQRLYVPLEVGNEIRALSIARGASFLLTKAQRDGSRSFEWKVERKAIESTSNAPASSPAPSSVPITQLESALKTAIKAACEAEKYGTMIGYVVRFSEESIKCMAITALIGMQQQQRG